ncbi:MAG: SRPBCC family protein [Gemmatimonadota bacterium]
MNEERATLIPPSTVRFERLLPGPIERVWAYITESKKRATWLAAGEFDLKVGGKIELNFDNASLPNDVVTPAQAGRHTFHGQITRFEPFRVLAHTWDWDGKPSDVLYELTPKGKDVLLTITHQIPDDTNMKRGISGGWVVHTGILADLLNGVEPRPFFTTHARIKQDYEALV